MTPKTIFKKKIGVKREELNRGPFSHMDLSLNTKNYNKYFGIIVCTALFNPTNLKLLQKPPRTQTMERKKSLGRSHKLPTHNSHICFNLQLCICYICSAQWTNENFTISHSILSIYPNNTAYISYSSI